jgi:diguanylate cyclase (GGDEF)-like protein
MDVIGRITGILPHGGSLPDEVWERRHRWILALLWAHVPAIAAFALVRGYGPRHAVFEMAPVVALATFASFSKGGRGLRAGMAAAGLMSCSAVLVHLSGGLIEMHFHFFVMIGVLTMYQDWFPFLVAIGYVVVHHGVMGVVDPRSVYNHPAAWAHPWTWAAVHGGFVLAASAAYIVAWRMNEEARAVAAHAQEEVEFLAYHDKLTGLANRAMFEDLLGMALARARRHELGVAVLYLDIDDFKLINDSLGHAAGDELLLQVAERLQSITRQTDLVARQGGDEFLVLLADLEGAQEAHLHQGPGAAYGAAESAAQRIQEALRLPFLISGHDAYASASIGLSLFPADASDAGTLLKNADTAMYWSKRAAPGGYRVYTDDEAGAARQLTFATRLRQAVERHDWMLYYQPLVELETGRMRGVEALLRWPDPAGGLIQPGEFIPLAEEMGLIEAIGAWVTEELARQDAEWRVRGLELGLSFNLSARQLRQGGLVEALTEPFTSHGVDPHRVVIEVTESAAMADPERTQWLFHDLRERGFRVAIDDFGTGYSSLSRLRHLPVDVLKIDRSFVRDLPGDRPACSMIAGIVRLAEGLGMTPFAEGVETEQQRAFLVEAGFGLAQGYLFARPMPADEIEGYDAALVGGGEVPREAVDSGGSASRLARP